LEASPVIIIAVLWCKDLMCQLIDPDKLPPGAATTVV